MASHTSDFSKDLDAGSVGEALVWRKLTSQKSVVQVIDVRNDKRFRRIDVDFLLQMNDKSIKWVEVKLDRLIHKSGNVAYELTTSGNIGCFEKTAADYIIYYDAVKMVGYMIDVAKLRDMAHSGDYSPVKMGDASTGYLIPIGDLKDCRAIKAEWRDK